MGNGGTEFLCQQNFFVRRCTGGGDKDDRRTMNLNLSTQTHKSAGGCDFVFSKSGRGLVFLVVIGSLIYYDDLHYFGELISDCTGVLILEFL